MYSLKPNEQRSKNAITFIWIMLVMEIISLVSAYFQYDLLQVVGNGGEVSQDAANNNDTRQSIIAIVYLLVSIVSIITFIQWFRRAYYNLHQLTPSLAFTEGWAAGSWFVPILNLFRPYQIMKELYQKTKEIILEKTSTISEGLNLSYIGIWWTLWIINNIVAQIEFRLSRKADTLGELSTNTVVAMISNTIGIILALITVKVISEYSKYEIILKEIKDDQEVELEPDGKRDLL